MDPNDQSIEYLEKCLSDALKEHDKVKEAKAYENLGLASASKGKFHEALIYHEKHKDIALDIGDKMSEGIAYGNLGNSCHELGMYTKAIEWQEKRLKVAREIRDRELEGGAYGSLGNCYKALQQNEKAIECYTKHLKISLEIGKRHGEAIAYANLGNVCLSQAEYHKAMEYHEKCLLIAEEIGDKQLEGAAYGNLGNSYKALADYAKAIECHQKHLEIALDNGDKQGEGIACLNLGISYESMGSHHQALTYLQKALKTSLEIGDRVRQAQIYGILGATYDSLGKYTEAIEYHEKHLEIALVLGDRKGEGNAYGNLGNVYQSMGMFNKAIMQHQKRLQISLDIDDKEGEGQAYGNLGAIYNNMGRYYDAIKILRKALEIQTAIGDKSGQAKTSGNLGNCYNSLGEFKQAIKFHQKRLDISIEIGDKDGEGQSYGNLGISHQLMGNYSKALEDHSKRLSVAQEIGDRNGEGNAYGNLGVAYCSLGKYQESIKYQEKRLAIAIELGDKHGEAAAYGNLGKVYRFLQNYERSLEYHEKDLKLSKEIGDKRGEAGAQSSIGQLFYMLGNFSKQSRDQNLITSYMKKSECHLKESLECYEWLFDHLEEQDEFKVSILERFHFVYKLLTIVNLENQDPVQALLVSERGRARALRDILDMKYGVQGKPNDQIALSDLESIFLTSNFSLLFYAQIQSNRAFWILSRDRISFSLQSGLSGKDQEIVQLVEGSYNWMRVREATHCEDRSIGVIHDEDLDENVEAAVPDCDKIHEEPSRNGIGKSSRNVDLDFVPENNGDENPLESLYEALVAPVQNALDQDEVVFIPDGPMFSVPFAALKDPKTGKFLSETKRIRLAPSLETLQTLQDSSEKFHSKSGALIIGDPDIGKVIFRRKERSFIPLPGAKEEAKSIGNILGVKPLTGSEATKEVVLQKLEKGVSVIHFAAHGSEEGEILLAPPKIAWTEERIPEEQDFVLTAKEAQERGIKANLVVLSCCHSGRGEVKAEGLIGLSRAFLAAGARAVVASLWAIDDQATKKFMLSFYSHLKDGKSASVSLHLGMKELRESFEYSDPMFWAPFYLIGDDVTLNFA